MKRLDWEKISVLLLAMMITVMIITVTVSLHRDPGRQPRSSRLNKKNNPYLYLHTEIVNPHQFVYLANPKDACSVYEKEGTILVVAYIHSAPDHLQQRMAIRSTWGSMQLFSQLRMVVVFGIGVTTNDDVNSAVTLESERYMDIVQENYNDSYRNLTYKAIAGLNWVSVWCPQAEFLLKVDDDNFVNSFALTNYLNHLLYLNSSQVDSSSLSPNVSSTILCSIYHNAAAFRHKNNKWFVSLQEYPDRNYPDYCMGSAYIVPAYLVPQLYSASQHVPFYWIDDVYITGFLPYILRLNFTDLKLMYALEEDTFDRMLLNKEAFFAHMTGSSGVDQVYNYWKTLISKEGSHPMFRDISFLLPNRILRILRQNAEFGAASNQNYTTKINENSTSKYTIKISS